MIEYNLPCFGMVVTIGKNGAGRITSELDTHRPETDIEHMEIKAAFNAIESLVLACAMEGFSIDAPAFVRAIETAVEACTNQFT